MKLRAIDAGLGPLDGHIVTLLMTLAHDIRGPIVSVMAGLQVVRNGGYGGMDAGVSEKIGQLHSGLGRLLGMADDYLGKACCMDGGLLAECEPLHLVDDVLAVVQDELACETRANPVFLDRLVAGVPAGAAVVASRLGMKIVYRNLIRNAVRHGGAGCAIVCGYEERDDHHRLNVYNTGTPIPPEDRDRLFAKFGTLGRPGAPGCAGVGLGLYLVREVVRSHGGAIWYEARPAGSDFVFTLPKAPPASRGAGFRLPPREG